MTMNNIFNSICFGKCLGIKIYNSRYYLEISYKKEPDNTAVVILMNPSSTARQNIFFNVPLMQINDCDKTTKNVLNILHFNNNSDKHKTYDKIIFLNVFPYYSSSPKQLDLIFNKKMKNSTYLKNIRIIRDSVKNNKNADFYCGWGKRKKLKYGYEDVDKILKKYSPKNVYCYDSKSRIFTKYQFGTLFVCHGSTWK